DYIDRFAGLLEALRVFPKPVIAVLNGVTLAGGLELAMCCDLVVAADTARIGDAHANYGVFPGGGGAAVLPTQVPRNVARYLLFTGGTMSAAQLHALGFVNEVHPADTLDQAAQTLAERIAEKSPLALSRMKSVANRVDDCGPTAALNHEQVLFRQHQRSWDMNEGLTAFTEKRKPTFRGI
ncbi:MAG: enoyl-CoA hydratase/isomerase family protein, partial [Panacagrimonas sp.]